MSRKDFVLQALRKFGAESQGEDSVVIHIGTVTQLAVAHNGNQTAVMHANNNSSSMDERERSRHYRVCHAIAKQYDLYPEMRKCMGDRWRAESMRDLPDQALRELFEYMRSLERRIFEVK